MRFDPALITYEDLLERFWASHDPTAGMRSTQYRSALFVHDEQTRTQAEASRDRLADRLGAPVATEIIAGVPFYPAEGYHQKWRLRRDGAVLEDLQACFPNEAALLRSAAAAKLNGFVGGADRDGLTKYHEHLGLSPRVLAKLLR